MSLSERLQSRWALSLIAGVPFAAFMTVFWSFTGPGWPVAALMGLVAGSAFGAVMGWLLAAQQRRVRAALGGLSGPDARSVTRKAFRGAVPVDPAHRDAARQLAEVQLRQVMRFRTFGLVLFGTAAILGPFQALFVSPVYWVGAGAGVVMVLVEVLMPIHLRRRIALLSASQDPS